MSKSIALFLAFASHAALVLIALVSYFLVSDDGENNYPTQTTMEVSLVQKSAPQKKTQRRRPPRIEKPKPNS